ncbi:MAG: PEP/pyruvate-binding domain-containing protein [Thermodesulfobacteriota bacterium]
MKILDLFSTSKSCRLLVNLDGAVVEKYRFFKEFLGHNYLSMQRLAELEQTYFSGTPFNMREVEERTQDLLKSTRRLVRALDGMGRGRYHALLGVVDRLVAEIAPLYYPAPHCLTGPLVLPLENLDAASYRDAGGKATNLALMARRVGLPIPPGFVVSAMGFTRFMEEARLKRVIEVLLATLDPDDLEEVETGSQEIREMIMETPLIPALADKILAAYEALEERTVKGVRLAMRSSAVGEDSEASFAGLYDTRLNVAKDEILQAYQEVVASKYSARAILYRLRYGLDDQDTPMCVAGIAMVDSRASGVLYTVDPAKPDSGLLKISAVLGQGEYLVSGETSPDGYFVDRQTLALVDRRLGSKSQRLVTRPTGGLCLEETPAAERNLPAVSEEVLRTLSQGGLKLERYFQGPQDVEWAVDQEGRLFFLQSRPLALIQTKTHQETAIREFPGHPLLLAGGTIASPGVAAGVVWQPGRRGDGKTPPENAILVARTASPDYASLMNRINGLITDVGSVTSHLASVAREFGVPALFDVAGATQTLTDGREITLAVDSGAVYQGIVAELAESARPTRLHVVNSPMHARLRAVLDKLSPLNLTDPQAPEFGPAGCRTLHDVIRFAHERAMQEMFGLSEAVQGENVSARLHTSIPFAFYLIDLGGGLTPGLTTCDAVTPENLESVPLKALWRGLSNPGINWSGGIGVGMQDFLSLMARGMSQRPGELPGGDSFAVISKEYANLSAKFGYHYANLDAMIGDNPEANYFSLQFSGGAGTQAGRSLRLSFLGEVLDRLGCKLRITGDLLDASLSGLAAPDLEAVLDQVGRLLGASRLLDVAIASEAEVDRLVAAFFRGDYDFFRLSQENRLPDFYTPIGVWRRVTQDGRSLILEDGSGYGRGVSSSLAAIMGRMVGVKYKEFLDSIKAYFFFPLAIAKDSFVTQGRIKVQARVAAGKIDQVAGLAFAIRDVGNYLVLRINALEDNFALFEYVNGKRFLRAKVLTPVTRGEWYEIAVAVQGNALKGYLNGELKLEYTADNFLQGFVGLWSRADSVSYYEGLAINAAAPGAEAA